MPIKSKTTTKKTVNGLVKYRRAIKKATAAVDKTIKATESRLKKLKAAKAKKVKAAAKKLKKSK
jgi:hypothetical protein